MDIKKCGGENCQTFLQFSETQTIKVIKKTKRFDAFGDDAVASDNHRADGRVAVFQSDSP